MAPEMTQAEIDALNARRAYNRESYAKHREQRLQDKREEGVERKKKAAETGTRFTDMFSERQQENRRRAANAYKKRLYYGDSERSVTWRKQTLVSNAKVRAKKAGMEFSLTVESLHWPEFCPVFGFKINYGAPTDGYDSWDGPSIDRHDNAKGYTLENSVVMSRRANALKSNADVNEIEKLLSYMRKRFII